jgi:hypothetical protein
MSANTNLEIVNLDFFTLKNNLKKYLSSQEQFKDYDFNGSNFSVLLDLLSYNTYMNSFYLNMAVSEMFLDSAQIRDSVISHAKELNYLPRSFQSASAIVNLTITPNTPVDSVTILKGTSLTSRIGSNTYSFFVDENIILTSTNGVFTANGVTIYEGELVSETFLYDSSQELNLVLSNPTIDTRSISVFVAEDNGENVLEYTRGTTFLGLNANSQVFFVQSARNERYEIVFGNGIQGRIPKDGSAVVVGYRVCNGELPNGAAVFSINAPIDGHSNVSISVVNAAQGGLVSESLQSIKKNAPRAFQTQERAVTASDYKIALQTEFPEIESINVFGGEDADPPQYGRVFICVNLENSIGTPAFKKQIYRDYIRTITPLSIDPVFIDPDFMFIQVTTLLRYNIAFASVPENSLKSLAENKIQSFNEQNLNDFGVTFRYSKLVAEIDSIDKSIVSNETDVLVYKEITPSTSRPNTFTINFYNELDNPFVEEAFQTHRAQDQHALFTTSFTFENQLCRIEDNNVGGLNIVAITGDTHVIVKPIGLVNYSTGKVLIENFQPSSFPPGPIRVFAITKENDVAALRNNILQIKPSDISVSVQGIRQ